MTLDDKIENFKRSGFYQVTIFYGEGTGCDDLDVPRLKRTLRILAVPVGCIGECKVVYSGKVETFLEFDFSQFPIEVSNPPNEDEIKKIEEGGWYIWGINETVNYFRENVWPKLQSKGPAM